jgi:uncharacterized protein (TIGR02001 family)
MKNILSAFLIMLSTSAFAGWNASLAYTNDYVMRGMSQGDSPATQLGVSYSHDLLAGSVYAGAWTSEVEFGDNTRETDYYVGFSMPLIADYVEVDFSFVDYRYDNSSSDYEEVIGTVSFPFMNLDMTYARVQDDINDEFANATWTLPYIDQWVEVAVIYNYFQQNDDQVMFSVGKTFESGIGLYTLTGEDYLTGERFNAVSFSYSL